MREGLRVLEPFLGGATLEELEKGRAGRLLGVAGLAHLRLGEVEKAIGYFDQALLISREIGDRQGEGACLSNRGMAYGRVR